MRLIDADALDTRIEYEFDGVCVYDVSGSKAARDFCEIVDTAPTIDAIPMEWLLQKWKQPLTTDGNPFEYVLMEWQKESAHPRRHRGEAGH